MNVIGRSCRLITLTVLLAAIVVVGFSKAALGQHRPQAHAQNAAVPHSLAVPAPHLAAAPQSVPRGVTPATCPETAASLCGYVTVPLDHSDPKGTKLHVYFEVYPHTAAGPAESAILVNLGGPGPGTTQDRDYLQYLLAANLDVHDLLLIDNRGTGLSDAIDCPELQNGTAAFVPSEEHCVTQLGKAASRYSSGDVAQDVEAVRCTLGYNLVDYFGASFGGVDATAYALRYGEHVRSLVLDAPLGAPGLAELVRLHDRVHSDPRMVRLVCERSKLCSEDQPEPDDTFLDLIENVRRQPVEGDSHDASGNAIHVRIDENALLNFVVSYPQGGYVNTGEILAAAVALQHGDKAPLLRLGAEGFFKLVGPSGDPTGYSNGTFYANSCASTIEPYSFSVPVRERREQYDAAVAAAPRGYFEPFTPRTANDFLFSGDGRQCFWWQEPTPFTPVVPIGSRYPKVPTLVLDGDIDNRVPFEETKQVAALFPDSTHVIVAEAGHETTGWSQCAANLASHFIETLQTGDTSCAATPGTVFPAVGRFPYSVADARPAKPDGSGNNQIGLSERKTVSVGVATAIDALQRTLIGAGSGVGLRGGTFTSVFGGTTVYDAVTLTNCSLATDAIVNGTLSWGNDYSILGDLTITGPGTAGGTLHITGFWENAGTPGNFSVTGTLGGKQVAVLVPEA